MMVPVALMYRHGGEAIDNNAARGPLKQLVPFSLGNLGFAATFCRRKYFDESILDPQITCFEDRTITEIVHTGLLPHLENAKLDSGKSFYNDYCGDPNDLDVIYMGLEASNKTHCLYDLGTSIKDEMNKACLGKHTCDY